MKALAQVVVDLHHLTWGGLGTAVREIQIQRFAEADRSRWDDFVFHEAVNATFHQSRRFLDYHPPDRWVDESLLFLRGGAIIAVLPACGVVIDGARVLYSHRGATFGGLAFSRRAYGVTPVSEVVELLVEHAAASFDEIMLRQPSAIFCERSPGTVEYFLHQAGFQNHCELSSVIDLAGLNRDDPMSSFRPNTRQKICQGRRAGLRCEIFDDDESIQRFHAMMTTNLIKHNVRPVHSVPELIDLKRRFPSGVRFLRCLLGDAWAAAGMIWSFGDRVLHAQSLAVDYAYAHVRPNNVMIMWLIEMALREGYRYFSFGVSTENLGRYLNMDLTIFKEGFGTDGYVNRIFYKRFS